MGDKVDKNPNESTPEQAVETENAAIVVPPPAPPVIRQSDNSIEGFISQAIERGLPVETIERFLAMRKEFRADQAREAFVMAMAQFQKDCPVIAKTKVVTDKDNKPRYKFAPLDSIVLQVKKPLGDNSLAYGFREERSQDNKSLTVICTITHSMGHSEESSFTVEIGTESFMSDTQKYGARNTFAKRYAFMNALGILTGDEDTDARELTQKPPKTKLPLDPKARVIALLRLLGTKDTKDPEATAERIYQLTGLRPDTNENIPRIIELLEILVQEKNDNH
ncbi:hypothetical protein A2Z56_02590 [Candidatus Kaiserbacteria bacterium RIFCSPHIGHO2_12_45_16]|nr:MAG: hypothetical protein A2Z56_02590 [Candidatus Kaiserbacteria bacterium RIFCSPHIGHO2_12_45_16]